MIVLFKFMFLHMHTSGSDPFFFPPEMAATKNTVYDIYDYISVEFIKHTDTDKTRVLNSRYFY